jgi:hypothetical protein
MFGIFVKLPVTCLYFGWTLNVCYEVFHTFQSWTDQSHMYGRLLFQPLHRDHLDTRDQYHRGNPLCRLRLPIRETVNRSPGPYD